MDPFTNVEYLPPTPTSEINQYATQLSGNFQAIQVGSGAQAYKADRSGIWLGANTFAEAPFSVDMQGNVWANSIVIAGLDGSIIASSIDSNGNFVKQLISSNFNTQTKQILGEFTFGSSGAIAIKTDASNGVWISPTGVLTKKAGATTFALDLAGNATFGGIVVGASGTFGTVTAGTFTGCTFQTATSGYRAVMNSANGFQLYNGATWQGSLKADYAASVLLQSAGNIYLMTGANQMAFFTANSVDYPSGYKMTFAGGRHIRDTGSAIEFNADLIPDSDEDQDIGYATMKWNNIRAQTLWQQTNTNGSRQVYDFAYIEMNLLPKRMINKRLKGEEGMVMTNGYVPGLELPYKQGTVLKWTSKGLSESNSVKDTVIAIASDKGLPIVLGAEPVRIIGTAKIGDYIVPSNKKGCAMAVNRKNYKGDKIGVCLKNKRSKKEELILVMINF
jgi:hypothetical protein